MENTTLVQQIHDVVDNIPTVYEQGSGWGAVLSTILLMIGRRSAS